MARPFVDFVHPDDVPATFREVEKLGRGEHTVRFENRYRTPSGEWRWLQWNSRMLDGLIYASARDVTDLRSDLRARQHEVELLQLAEQLGNFGHWRIDLPTQRVYWSPNIYRIHGRDPATYSPTLEEGIEAYHPDDRERVSRYMGDAIENKRGFDFRLRIVQPSGDVRLVHSIGRCELDKSGEAVGIFGIFQDVTERELELRQRNEELQTFAYTAAHDLQAPLSSMTGLLSLLRSDLDEQALERVHEHVDRLSGLATRMRELVEEVSSFAKAVGDSQHTEQIPLDELIDVILERRRRDLEEAQAQIERPARLPTVIGARGPLEAVFANLIDNAIKFRSRERPLRVTIENEPADELCRLRIKDNGVGFDMEHADEVFGLFKQLAPRLGTDGRGMGLALCRKIVRRHGGEIEVRARPGEGATFELTLPRAPTVEQGLRFGS